MSNKRGISVVGRTQGPTVLKMTAPEDYTTFLVKHLPSEITPGTLRTIFGAYGKVLAAIHRQGKAGRKGSDQSDGTELSANKFALSDRTVQRGKGVE